MLPTSVLRTLVNAFKGVAN